MSIAPDTARDPLPLEERTRVRAGAARRGRAIFIAVAVLAISAQAPLLGALLKNLATTGAWGCFAWLMAAAAAALAVRHRVSLLAPTRRSQTSPFFWTIAAVTSAAAIMLRSPAAASVALLLTLLAATGAVFGPQVRNAVVPAWVSLWAACPSPFNREVSVLSLLGEASIRQAGRLLDLAGVRHWINGGAIETAEKAFPLPDGGIAILVSMTGVALAAALLRRGPVWSTVLVASALLWSFFLQAAAIAFPVFEASSGSASPLLGAPAWVPTASIVLLTLLLAWSTDRGLLWLTPHGGEETWQTISELLTDESTGDGDSMQGTSPAAPRRTLARDGVAFLLVFAAVGALWILPPTGRKERKVGSSPAIEAERKPVADDV